MRLQHWNLNHVCDDMHLANYWSCLGSWMWLASVKDKELHDALWATFNLCAMSEGHKYGRAVECFGRKQQLLTENRDAGCCRNQWTWKSMWIDVG